MDSITQFVLGSAVGIAVSPKKTPKIAIISGLIATLPDLDVVLDYGDSLTNVVKHRGFSHSLIYLTLFAPVLALLLVSIFKTLSFYKWWLLSWLVLVTHPLLDSFTIYGTALFLPLSEMRVMIGSIFIIDLLYTLPLLVSFIYLLITKRLPIIKGMSLNSWMLLLSTSYLAFTLVVKSVIVPRGNSFATPTPFNTFSWRVVEVGNERATQYFTNILGERSITKSIPLHQQLSTLGIPLQLDILEQYSNFSSGFYNLKIVDNELILQDLRMGNIFNPSFSFIIAKKEGEVWKKITPLRLARNVKFEINNMFWQY